MEPLLPSDPESVGPYLLVARLGGGGTGQVYLARSAGGERVALRVIKRALLVDDARWRLADEVQTLFRVVGPRAVRLDNADLHDDPPWLAVEYVPGRSLGEHVLRDGPLDAKLTAALGVMLADALDEIHGAGTLHRDLKPRNVILGPDGPKVVDAGLAVLWEPSGPAYLAPEQVAGRDVTSAADVYALGATLVYAASAHILYPDRAASSLLAAIVDPYKPPNLSGVPEELVSALAAMINADPAARPSVDDLRRRLVRLAGGPEALDDLGRRLVESTYAEPEGAYAESDGPWAEAGESAEAGAAERASFDPERTAPIGPPVDPPSHAIR
ncbi:serine/threonine protein kinase [Frankia sp. CNm7]|uniref:non-specific serine/threonine protein kinase n=1 Tax=Frankia nepalensis TaxID=1836974 RepID=A0A937US89_9ACTN|nr:serine/threonine-protein kinase [Frankia nepalensis]MBL7500071.1 serine/threonine protein kinase [Frankia nepalensis]MBL7509395.1 serine/threonine protein kinase [Frankia nepalensis]MBL7522848.1 serine/threonine protein kinase [Frankia nepalensis]MBL7631888.1 serine/threonine protein kinase [Frankia nepalensis]